MARISDIGLRRTAFAFAVVLLVSGAHTARAQEIEGVDVAVSRIDIDSIRVNLEYLTGVRLTPIGADSIEVRDPLTGWRMVADTVWRMNRLHRGLPQRFIADRLRSFGYEPAILETTAQAWFGTVHPVNVTAVLEASSGRSETVIVGAHFDIHPLTEQGADDNGTGVAAVLELARVLAGSDPEISVVFGFWDTEEQGALGSGGFANEAFDRGDDFAAAVNLDMIGWSTGTPEMMVATIDERSDWLANRVVELAEDLSLQLKPYRKTFGRSDHVAFARHGYPSVMLCEDYDGDFNPYYHSSGDRIEHINFDFLLEMTRLATATVVSIAWDPPAWTAVLPGEWPTITDVRPYPVPANTWIRFDGGSWVPGTHVALFDLLGREVARSGDRQMDVSGLAAGVYVYRIEQGQTNAAGVIAVQH